MCEDRNALRILTNDLVTKIGWLLEEMVISEWNQMSTKHKIADFACGCS